MVSRKFNDLEKNYNLSAIVSRKFNDLEKNYSLSHSVDPQKLRVGVKYYMVHMYSMPYYTYGSAANNLFLGSTALIYIKRTAL